MQPIKTDVVPMNEQVQRDALDFFTKERGGHIGYLQYGSPAFDGDPVIGASLWTELRTHSDYYLAQEDDDVLKAVIQYLLETTITVTSLVDLGPGDINALKTKTIPLVHAINGQKYIAVDMCEQYAMESAEMVENLVHVNGQHLVSNFFKDVLPSLDNVLLFMGGGTITNLDVGLHVLDVSDELIAQLMRLRKTVKNNGYLLLGFDANQDANSLNASYQNDVHGRLAMDALRHIQRDTNLVLDPECFSYHGQWLPEHHRYAHCVIAICDTKITSGDLVIDIKKDDIFHLDNSYKYPVELMTRAAEQAGWKKQELWTLTGRAHYILLQAD